MTAILTPAATSLSVEAYASFEAAEAVASEWDALIERLGGSLYMTPAWCGAWWKHYGTGRRLHVIAVRDGDRLVGVLPFFVDRLLTPAGRCRVAKLVGSDSTIAFVDPPVEPEAAREAFALAYRELLCDARADVVHIGPFSSEIPQSGELRTAVEEVADLAHVLRDAESGEHTLFELPDGFDAYLQKLSKNQRSNYRRSLNKLNKAFAFEVDVVADPQRLPDELDAFMAMHQAQWKAVGKLGHFGDWRSSREFTFDLVRRMPERVRLIRLLADGEVVSYYFCFELHGVYYWRLPGRLVDERWDQYSLGRVGLMKMMETAAAEGATSIEAGNGRYDYKDKLNARTVPLRSLTLCRNSLGARCRARLTLALGDLLDLGYYRAWYLKAAPRLPFPRRGLWRSWVRRRF